MDTGEFVILSNTCLVLRPTGVRSYRGFYGSGVLQVVETKGSLLGMGNAVGLAVWFVFLAQARKAIDPSQLWEERGARIKGTPYEDGADPNYYYSTDPNNMFYVGDYYSSGSKGQAFNAAFGGQYDFFFSDGPGGPVQAILGKPACHLLLWVPTVRRPH